MNPISYFNKTFLLFLLVFCFSCQKKEIRKDNTINQIINTKTSVINSTMPIETSHQKETNTNLYCDLSNYLSYIYDEHKTKLLIQETEHGCQLDGANFKEAQLEKANFTKANLEETDFTRANLEEANFSGANLEKANFTKANLEETDFTRANLRLASFSKANLDNTFFIETNLEMADLRNTNYEEAYFRKSNLTKTKYNHYNAITNYIRKFSGQGIIDPEEKGMVKVENKETE